MFGLDIHPSIVHFPVALVAVGALAEVAYLTMRRRWLQWFGPILLSLALLGAGGAYFSGKASEDRAEHQGVPGAAIESHESTSLWALGAIGLATLLSWATHPRGKGLWLATLIAAGATGLTFWTGHLGGKLVFIYGAGRVGASAGAAANPGGSRGEHAGTQPTSGGGTERGESEHGESEHEGSEPH